MFYLCFAGNRRNSQPSRRPDSDWIPYPLLIVALSKFLPSDAIELITKHYNDHRVRIRSFLLCVFCLLNGGYVFLIDCLMFDVQKGRLTRFEMIQRVRHIAGDNLLMAVIKSYRGKV